MGFADHVSISLRNNRRLQRTPERRYWRPQRRASGSSPLAGGERTPRFTPQVRRRWAVPVALVCVMALALLLGWVVSMLLSA